MTTGPRLATAFMGTPDIAVPALRLLAARSEVRCVLTQPDRPAGRGRQVKESPVAGAAAALGVPVWKPDRLHLAEVRQRLEGVDLAIVMAYGMVLGPRTLAVPRHGCINLHASLLPRWRGASPLQAALRAGDAETGISVMRMVPALDAGPVHLCERLVLPADATLPWLHDQLAELAARALGRFLDAWPTLPDQEQDEASVTWCGKLTTDDGRLDWSRSAAELERQIRAYTPAPGCWTVAAGERWRIAAARVLPGATGPSAGTTAVVGRELHVGCGQDTLVVLRVQAPGGKELATADFLNGRRPPERFD